MSDLTRYSTNPAQAFTLFYRLIGTCCPVENRTPKTLGASEPSELTAEQSNPSLLVHGPGHYEASLSLKISNRAIGLWAKDTINGQHSA